MTTATVKRNPKQEGTNVFDCKPQVGLCPIGCNQCFHNRPGAFYTSIYEDLVPTPEEVGDGIVRMNSGHDSNIQRDLVIATALKYDKFFFNTSIPRFDFPGPVVLTANPREEERPWQPIYEDQIPRNLMFVRLRVSSTNLNMIYDAARWYTHGNVPVVLTFMSYYTDEPQVPEAIKAMVKGPCYVWKTRILNSYWCPTEDFIRFVMLQFRSSRLVSYCGSLKGSLCRNCRNCETYYVQTAKRLAGE